jgi:hypothetical protein
VDGILVEPNGVDALAEALDRLMSDAALRGTLGGAGRARMRDTFDHRAMAARLVGVYERVAREWAAGRRTHLARPDEARPGPDAEAIDRILGRIAAHVRSGPRRTDAAAAPTPSRTHRVRELLQRFRREPIGGRLMWLKKLIYWFTASTFDRHAKLEEAMLAALVEMEQELAQLHFDQEEHGRRAAPPSRSSAQP